MISSEALQAILTGQTEYGNESSSGSNNNNLNSSVSPSASSGSDTHHHQYHHYSSISSAPNGGVSTGLHSTSQQQQQLQLEQQEQQYVSTSAAANRMTIALACTTCRGRHLKCDGRLPCSRCRLDEVECLYVKSRRGYKGPRRAKADGNSTTKATAAATAGPGSSTTTGPDDRSSAPEEPSPQYGNLFKGILPEFATGGLDLLAVPSIPQTPLPVPQVQSGRSRSDLTSPGDVLPSFLDAEISNHVSLLPLPDELRSANWQGPSYIKSFYEHFQACHPFILPKPQLAELLRTRSLQHLVLVMQWIGSFYSPSAPTQLAREFLADVLSKTRTKDGFYVQAVLLFAIGLQAANRSEDATSTIAALGDHAVRLHMHRAQFAWVNGNGSAYLEESWRRTWWELFVVYGMLSAMNFAPFRLFHIEAECLLPCEEDEYISGSIPAPRAFADMQDAEFMDEAHPFSSFAYRVDAIHRVGIIMEAITSNPLDPIKMAQADTGLSNWYLQLPESKRAPVDRDGKFDEILFQAHLITSGCGILLNRPRSDLNIEDVVEVKTCVNNGQAPVPGAHRAVYTAKAVAAANSVANLITLPTPLLKHTPFTACITTMAAVTYLSYWSFCSIDGSDTFTKEQIRLTIGTLRAFGDLWPVAHKVLGQVRGVARELYGTRRAINSANWEAVTGRDIIGGINEKEADALGPTMVKPSHQTGPVDRAATSVQWDSPGAQPPPLNGVVRASSDASSLGSGPQYPAPAR